MQVKSIKEHSAIRSTFIELPFVIKIFFCLFLSGRFTQVLLFSAPSNNIGSSNSVFYRRYIFDLKKEHSFTNTGSHYCLFNFLDGILEKVHSLLSVDCLLS